MIKRVATAAVVLAASMAFAGSASASLITPAVEYVSTGTLSDSRPFTLGYSFTLSSAVTINALGYWDDGLGNNHLVGIWDSVGNLIVSTTVLGGDALIDNFRWDPIANLTLGPGSYTIGGEFLGNNDPFPSNATGVTAISQYTWVTDEQAFGAGLNFPTVTTSGGYGPNGILAPNFSVASDVPEPTTLAVFGIALLSLFGFSIMRRRADA